MVKTRRTSHPPSFAEHMPQVPRWKQYAGELLGTFALTVVAAGGDVIDQVSGGDIGRVARVTAPGLLVMAFIYALSDVSGAHFNPAVTFGFALRGDFDWRLLPRYWMAQLFGAILAALLLKSLFGNVGHLGASTPHATQTVACVMEILLSWLLVTVILGTASRQSKVEQEAAIAVGATIILCGLIGSPISGASMNPARSLGPVIVSGWFDNFWLYIAGPLVGSSLAALTVNVLHTRHDTKEQGAASGDRER